MHFSNAWQAVVKIWPKVENDLIWRISDGKEAKFLDDHWILGIHCLRDFTIIGLS